MKELREILDNWLKSKGITNLKYDVWYNHTKYVKERGDISSNILIKLSQYGRTDRTA